MKSFTYMSDEAIEATCEALPFKYRMDLNQHDMTELLTALQVAWDNGNEWAGDFASSIATTVEVEMV